MPYAYNLLAFVQNLHESKYGIISKINLKIDRELAEKTAR